MNKCFFPALIFLLITSLPFCGNAQGHLHIPGNGGPSIAGKSSLSGKVLDAATGAYLSGASIYIADLKTGTVSNADGSYLLENLPSGRHLVEVSYVGYATITEYVTIDGAVAKDFKLHASILENNEVVVTGVSSAMQARRAPAPISIVKKQDLVSLVSGNLINALSHSAGVTELTTGPAVSKPFIRGLGYNRVIVVNDGVRQEGQQWGDEHGVEIDEYSVNKVEIMKGPASLMYGSDALAGVINIITNVPVPSGTIKGSVLANYQTNNKFRGTGVNVGGNNHGFNWNAWGSYKAAADYRNKYDGPVYNSKFNERNVGGYLGYNGSWGYSHIIFSSFNQHLGLVEGERDASGHFIKPLPGGNVTEPGSSDFNSASPQIPYQAVHHFKVTSDNNVNIGSGRLALNVGFQRNQRSEYGNADDPGTKDLYFDLNTVTYSVIYNLAESKGWRSSIGGNGMSQHNLNKGKEVLIPEYGLFDAGLFVYSQKNWDKFSLSGGLRFDNRSVNSKPYVDGNNIKFKAFKKDYSNFSGSAGISYLPSKYISFKLNLARGFRSPSIPELGSNGAHEGTNRYEYGDNGLKSETSFQADGGVELNSEHVSLTASVFINSINHFIFYRKLESSPGVDSLVAVNGQLIPAFQFDQHKARLYGVEAMLDIHPHPLDWLHFENIFSLSNGRFADAIEGTKNLPLIPAARLISELRSDLLHKGKRVRNLSIKVETDASFAQRHPFTAFDTETKTGGYILLNAGFNFDLISSKRTICTLYFMGNNLTDVAYQNHLSRLKYTDENPVTGRMGVFNTGRNFSLKLEVPLQWEIKKQS